MFYALLALWPLPLHAPSQLLCPALTVHRCFSLPQAWLSGLPVPKYHFTDPRLRQRLRDELPVVIQGTGLVDVACAKWTLAYLVRECKPENRFTVYGSPNKYFRFSSPTKNAGGCVRCGGRKGVRVGEGSV